MTKNQVPMESRDLLIGGLIVGGLIYATKQQADRLAQQISWKFDGINFYGLGFEGGLNVRLLPRIRITNESDLTIPVEKFDGKLLYLGKDLMPIISVGDATIKARQETVLRYQIGIKKSHLEQVFGKTWKEIWDNKENYVRPSNYVVAGTITFRVSGVVVEHDISQPFVIS